MAGRVYKTRRQARYWFLRERHFVPQEARAFSKLTKAYPALKEITRYREKQWIRFDRRAKEKGWGSWRRGEEWKATLLKFYRTGKYKTRRDKATGGLEVSLVSWIVKKDVHGRGIKPTISPWEWYDAVFQRLPPELKWDTPRSHRVRQPEVKIDRVKVQRWIAQLRDSARLTGDPKQRAKYRMQIDNLRKSLRRGQSVVD